jgi:archaeal cell division control protein 6
MGLFNDMLKSNETLFKNELALDFSYQPKLVPFREAEQRKVAFCIKPMMDARTGKSIFIYGQPGVGKTTALKHVLEDLENETDEVVTIYINCWQKNTSYKIFADICEQLDFKFIQNKKTEDLFRWIKQVINKKSAVFVFDEADKLEDTEFLYMILEEIYRKSVILITNYKDWLMDLEDRTKSRLMPEVIEFKPYDEHETKEILKQRLGFAFHSGVVGSDVLDLIAKKAFELQDIRTGLHMFKEAGLIAESKSSRKITLEHANAALEKIDEFSIKNQNDLPTEDQMILEAVKKNSGKKIGELFKLYQDGGGKLVYKSFQRKIDKLEKNRFITVEKTAGGPDGNTTIVRHSSEKKLSDF